MTKSQWTAFQSREAGHRRMASVSQEHRTSFQTTALMGTLYNELQPERAWQGSDNDQRFKDEQLEQSIFALMTFQRQSAILILHVCVSSKMQVTILKTVHFLSPFAGGIEFQTAYRQQLNGDFVSKLTLEWTILFLYRIKQINLWTSTIFVIYEQTSIYK